jgi:hypothetical protein
MGEWVSVQARVRVKAPMETIWGLWSDLETLPQWQVHIIAWKRHAFGTDLDFACCSLGSIQWSVCLKICPNGP